MNTAIWIVSIWILGGAVGFALAWARWGSPFKNVEDLLYDLILPTLAVIVSSWLFVGAMIWDMVDEYKRGGY